jgi:hypothetical protein
MSERLHVKYLLFLSDFNGTSNISTDFQKSIKYQVASKSVQWKPNCSMRTDRHEGNSRFLQFCERA